MPEYWITTHWPTPETEPAMSRYVYVKETRKNYPQSGDVVFFREAIDANDKDGRRVQTVSKHYHGQVSNGLIVPKGKGGIIGVATVSGKRRKQQADDVVFDFGNLREWLVVPCHDFHRANLPLDDLRKVIDKYNVRGINLWRMPNQLGQKLLKSLRHEK